MATIGKARAVAWIGAPCSSSVRPPRETSSCCPTPQAIAAPIREQITAGMADLGIEVDPAANAEASGKEAKISTEASRTQVWVVPTNEELVIAHDASRLAIAAKQSP